MELKQEIPDFVQKLVNSRGRLLAANIGNTSTPVIIKHEALTKAFNYAKSIKTTEAGWIAYLKKWEADIRYLMIVNKSKPAVEQKLFYIILEINKR
jgi:hypothetical protein